MTKSCVEIDDRLRIDPEEALDRAIDAAGSQSELARQLGVSPQSVAGWKQKRVPAERCLAIEQVTRVPCWALRPDVFPRPRRLARRRAVGSNLSAA